MGQMTMTTPERRITLQRSQRGLTEAETFIDRLSHPVRDSTPGEVVGTQLDADRVARQDADEVLSQLAGDMGEHLVPVLQAHLEHRVRERGHDLTLDLDGILFYQALRTLNLLLKRRCVGHSERPPLRATRNGEYTRAPREAQGGCPAARPVPRRV